MIHCISTQLNNSGDNYILIKISDEFEKEKYYLQGILVKT